jgi:hypothetical protein
MEPSTMFNGISFRGSPDSGDIVNKGSASTMVVSVNFEGFSETSVVVHNNDALIVIGPGITSRNS